MTAGGASETIEPFSKLGERTNPYLFVVGAARSGTTLLQRMLDAHPLLAVVDETYWLLRDLDERGGLTRDGVVTDALVPLLLSHPKFPRMGVSRHELEQLLKEVRPIRYEQFVARIFDLHAAHVGKPLAGDKSPGHVRLLRWIHERWPRARFVHIIRDPRDVCLSMLEWRNGAFVAGRYGTWNLDHVVSAALYWRYCVALGREVGLALGPGLYHEVRYEDLVAHPEPELHRICDFLELPYNDAMARFYEGKTRPAKQGRSSKGRWLPPTVGLRDWSTQLPREDTQRLELAVGDLLGELGYERQLNGAAATVRGQVARVFEEFTAGVLAKGTALPRDWTL